MKRLILVLFLALAAVPAAVAKTSPGDFAAQWFRWASNSQWDRMYNTLHPAQQKLVTRDRFDECYGKSNLPPFEVASWKTVDTLHVKIVIPGTKTRAWSTVVTIRLKLKDSDTGKTESSGQTFHLFLVNGRWRWMLNPPAAKAFKAGRCPS